jgi:hypothetical protein
LVIVVHLLDVIAEHLGAGAVTFAHNGLPVLVLLVVYVVVLEQVDGGYDILLGELFHTVEVVFVGRDVPFQYIVEKEGKDD